MVPCVCIPMCYHPYSLSIIGIPTCHLILNMACQPTCDSLVVLKGESAADKAEWLNKLRNVIHLQLTHLVFVFLDIIVACRSEEELRWMSQEVRGYVEACANVPKVGLFS
ncbi:hypothetical protein AAG906_007447 [Vitis piasezkii]